MAHIYLYKNNLECYCFYWEPASLGILPIVTGWLWWSMSGISREKKLFVVKAKKIWQLGVNYGLWVKFGSSAEVPWRETERRVEVLTLPDTVTLPVTCHNISPVRQLFKSYCICTNSPYYAYLLDRENEWCYSGSNSAWFYKVVAGKARISSNLILRSRNFRGTSDFYPQPQLCQLKQWMCVL